MSEFMRYIGQPWEKSADGPDSWNCWTFTRHILSKHFGHEMPDYPVDEDKIISVVRTLLRGAEEQEVHGWVEVDGYQHGDIVMMAHVNHPSHIGVWLEDDGGGVLHCVRGAGVIFSNRDSLRLSGWGKLRFYRKCKRA